MPPARPGASWNKISLSVPTHLGFGAEHSFRATQADSAPRAVADEHHLFHPASQGSVNQSAIQQAGLCNGHGHPFELAALRFVDGDRVRQVEAVKILFREIDHAFFRIASYQEPAQSARIQQILAIPNPRGDPPALPGRQQKFDRSGSVLHHPCDCDGTVRAAVSRGFGFCL